MNNRGSIVSRLFAGACLLACTAAAPASQIAHPAYAHPQRMVEVEPGRRLNLYCLGKGTPTVVFVSGMAEKMTPWELVQPVTTRRSRACAYDRAGIGFSDPPKVRHSSPFCQIGGNSEANRVNRAPSDEVGWP